MGFVPLCVTEKFKREQFINRVTYLICSVSEITPDHVVHITGLVKPQHSNPVITQRREKLFNPNTRFADTRNVANTS